MLPTIYIEPDAGCCSPIKSMREGSFWLAPAPPAIACFVHLLVAVSLPLSISEFELRERPTRTLTHCLSLCVFVCLCVCVCVCVCVTLCRPGRLVKCSGISRNKKNQVLIYRPTVRVTAGSPSGNSSKRMCQYLHHRYHPGSVCRGSYEVH